MELHGQLRVSGSPSTTCKSPQMFSLLMSLHRWAGNQALMNTSCTQYHQPNNSKDEINDIRTAAVVIAILSGVDERFILATILQESGGCVRAPTSNNGVINPGLMQTHNGSGTCENLSPCPMSMIKLMVTDGTVGTNFGDGLKGCMSRAAADGSSDATAIYRAARIYNTGSYHTGGDLGTPGNRRGLLQFRYCQ
jgi:hypothetical protein